MDELKRGLEEHNLTAAGRRAYVTGVGGGADGFRVWLAIGCGTEGHRQMVERAVAASGGYEAVAQALFGDDKHKVIKDSFAEGDPPRIGSVTPAWVAMRAMRK